MHILIEGDFFVLNSNAHTNRHLARALVARGADVAVRHIGITEPTCDARIIEESGDLAVLNIPRDAPHAADVVLRHCYPPISSPPPSGRWAVLFDWELGGIPRSFIPVFQGADIITVPSQFTRDVLVENLAEAGLSPDVRILPCGVDHTVFHPAVEPDSLPDGVPDDCLKLLYVGGPIARKGLDILLDAYSAAFAPSDSVCLIVKGMGSASYYKGNSLAKMIHTHMADPARPPIIYTEQHLTDAQLAGLYASADYLVAPYRGEGFCLPAFEAIACGTPIIVTAGGPTDDLFVCGTLGFRIPAVRTVPPDNAGFGDTTILPAWLLEPDRDELVDVLRAAYRDRTPWDRESVAEAAEPWTWERAAEVCMDVIGKDCPQITQIAQIEEIEERKAEA